MQLRIRMLQEMVEHQITDAVKDTDAEGNGGTSDD